MPEHLVGSAIQLPELQILQPVQSEGASIHVPIEPATLQRLQVPSQEVLQQTPSTQWPKSQSPSKLHVSPKPSLVTVRSLQSPNVYICVIFLVVLKHKAPSTPAGRSAVVN